MKDVVLELLEKAEGLFEGENLRKRIIILGVSLLSLILSLVLKNEYISFVAIFLCGVPILLEALEGLLESFNIKTDLLAGIAIISSVIIGECFAGGEVGFIMALGEFLEDYTVDRARKGTEKIIKLNPLTVHKIISGEEKTLGVSEIRIGDIVRVYPGERIPVDGVITSGSTAIDASVITGESVPVDKIAGDEVQSGTMNTYGTIDFRVTKTGEDSTIQRMIRLVSSADASKARSVRIADKWATWIVVLAFSLSVLSYFVTGEIIRSVTVLVVFCPCSLILATPTAIMASIGNVSKRGVLVQNAEALERMAKVEKVAFDKTGTLTEGKMTVLTVKSVNPAYSDNEIYRLMASLERYSEHPIGCAVTENYKRKAGALQDSDGGESPKSDAWRQKALQHSDGGESPKSYAWRQKALQDSDGGESPKSDAWRQKTLRHSDGLNGAGDAFENSSRHPVIFDDAEDFKALPGSGLSGKVGGKEICIGRPSLFENVNVAPYEKYLNDGNTVICMSVDGVLSGFAVLEDKIRPSSKDTISEVKKLKVVPVLLTGDNKKVSDKVAKEVSVDEVHYECLPEDKLRYVSDKNAKVCMIGDGVNDAPSLKGAYVGVAMGLGGSDIATEASDIVLVKDNIEEIPHLLSLSRKMTGTIIANICFSMAVNIASIVLAMTGGIGPVAGALVHNGGSFLVVMNSALLLLFKSKKNDLKRSNV